MDQHTSNPKHDVPKRESLAIVSILLIVVWAIFLVVQSRLSGLSDGSGSSKFSIALLLPFVVLGAGLASCILPRFLLLPCGIIGLACLTLRTRRFQPLATMKIRRFIPWICGGALIVLVLLIWIAKRSAKTAGEINALPDTTKESSVQLSHTPLPMPINAKALAQVASTTNVAPQTWKSKEERISEELSKLNDVPIVFYGMLEDQFGNPVSEANVTGSIIYDNGMTSGVRELHVVSDSDGLFQVKDGKGESLGIMPRKEGFVLNSTNAGFRYSHFYPESRHVPDQLQPTIIKMWKLEGAEPLIHFQINAYLRVDGTPTTFDLQAGKLVNSGGDIAIRLESSPKPNVIEKYDWKATIQIVEGGIISFNGFRFEQMFQAPLKGYEPEFTIQYQKESKPWLTGFDGTFYFKSRGRFYGKLGLQLATDVIRNETVPIILSGYINPASSRNLEIDRSIVTEAKQ